MPTVTLWQRDSLHVTVSGGVDGVTFHAQDLDPPPMFGDEYEYGFRIAATDIPKLVQAPGRIRAIRGTGTPPGKRRVCCPQRCRVLDEGP